MLLLQSGGGEPSGVVLMRARVGEGSVRPRLRGDEEACGVCNHMSRIINFSPLSRA